MKYKHIQNRPEEWETVEDHVHLHGLLNAAPFPDPSWIQYLRKNRPSLEGIYKALFKLK